MSQAVSQPEWSADELRQAIKSARVALWTWIIDDDAFVVMDAKAYELWNVLVETDLTFEHLSPQRLSHRSGSGQGSVRGDPHHRWTFGIDFRILITMSAGFPREGRATRGTPRQIK
ncbi:hypothetical protein [Agrobacterium fabrum]|uniref:hypothetical protein n=1 Tax=Agrobacterium fabrum TaxID=1176649 RepID=UPI000F0C9AA8|nr:hypothetical protein [Agrobacterium fabrum]AYM65847.1 hypothetical protein At12D13_46950 [Agrobacterium fabrum]MDH6297946.1 hypothetical protein [Agrobacterium fabrum]